MSKRTFTVLVGTWGSNPTFSRGETITVDSEEKEKPFPYDVDLAVENGVLQEVKDEKESAKEESLIPPPSEPVKQPAPAARPARNS